MFDSEKVASYRKLFEAMPGASGLVLPNAPEFTVVAATSEFAEWGGVTQEEMIGKSLFRYFPDNPEGPNVSDEVRSSLAKCINERKTVSLDVQRYDIERADGTFYELYWKVIHTPILNDAGDVEAIIHSAINVTDRVMASLKDERIRALEPAYNLFRHSNIAIHFFKGPDLVIEMANAPTLRYWDRDSTIVGKPLREVLPELEEQHYFNILQTVYRSGRPYLANDVPVTFDRRDGQETLYFNVVFQAYFEDASPQPVGVMAMATDVTEEYLTRRALAERERTIALAEEVGDLGVFTVDLKSDTVSYSPQIMTWLSVTKLNLPVKDILKRVHAEDFELVSAVMAGENQEGSKHDIVFRVPHPRTGEIQYLRSIGQMQMEDGKPVTISGIIQDITKDVASQTAVEQSAQRLKSLIESAPFPIGVYIGREMRIEMVNQAILDVWGRDASVIGKTYREVLPELERQGPFEQLDEVFITGISFHAHNQRIDLAREGHLQTFYFNYSFTPLFDSSGKVYGVMNTAANVTDLFLAKQKVEQSEHNFRNIIKQAPVAMCLLRGQHHTIEVVNEPMLHIWGKSSQEVIDKSVFEALTLARAEHMKEILDQVYATGENISSNETLVILDRGGKEETIYQNVEYQPYRDSEGNIIGVLAISIDVTEQVLARHKIEEIVHERTKDLELANTRLQLSNAELEQFAYIASHDLQEPLRKIGMFTQMLEEEMQEASPRAKNQMERIQNAVSRMNNLIRDILGYSQLSRKTDVYRKTKLDNIIEEVLADFDLILEEKKGRVEYADLPVIDAIPLQMVQLFHNLISNALKYSKPDVPPIIVISSTILASEEAESLELSSASGSFHKITIKDNGIGFPQEYAQKIFNIFQRLHGKMEYAGTGIGLAMCKKIADNHHGAIYAESVEGEGSVFTVILPEKQQKSKV